MKGIFSKWKFRHNSFFCVFFCTCLVHSTYLLHLFEFIYQLMLEKINFCRKSVYSILLFLQQQQHQKLFHLEFLTIFPISLYCITWYLPERKKPFNKFCQKIIFLPCTVCSLFYVNNGNFPCAERGIGITFG